MAAKPFSLGYIGVGLMGGPMSQRLAKLGWEVTAYDIAPERLRVAHAAGIKVAASPAEAARAGEVVLLNLPTNDAVIDAVFGERGVAAAVSAKQLVADFSTIPVDECRRHAKRLMEQTGCRWVDLPVSGGPPASAAGSLTVMAGGEEADLERLAPLLRDISARCTRMGPLGSGLGAKMINQIIVGVGHAMYAEAVGLCAKAGIDAARIPECLAGGYADSNLLKAYWPRMVEQDFAPRGYLRQLLKDLEMVNAWAGSLKAPLPQLAQALSLLRLAASHGYAELDSSVIVKVYKP
ncbi:MAG: NAD(P)-dependent oxidoreductase [Betaproteobacteria bacterium]|nr:MAG: NAD(P)-dependent oxidoreductase [Betaproteobacteria bacterium]